MLYLVTLLLVSTIYYLAGSDSSKASASVTPEADAGGKPKEKVNAGNKGNDKSGEASTAVAAPEPAPLTAYSGLGSTFPQALLIPLTLSKRLHSIYMLRLFNDPFAMVLLYAAVAVIMAGRHHPAGWIIGCGLYS